MKFTIASEIFEKLPEFKVGVLVIQGLKAPQNPEVIRQMLDQAVVLAQSKRSDESHFERWRDAYRSFGLDPEETKPAHIALFDRASQNSVPSVLPLVDLLNSISLAESIPAGAHTLDNLSDNIQIRLTRETDAFQPMGKQDTESVEMGLPAYTSGNQVLTKNFIWRQGETSKLTQSTRDIFIPIDTLDDVSETKLSEILDMIAEKVTANFGGTVLKAMVTRTNPEFSWEQSTSKTPTLPEVLTRGVAEILPGAQALAQEMSKRKLRLYLGIDPTGSLLTLGHSVVLRKLQQFADLGHDVILLIGNGTVRIGDPTGRDSTRPELTDAQIQENFKSWKEQASKVLDFDKIEVRYNGDWLDKLTYQDMIKLMAQTTVQQLMERDMFQDRIAKELPIFGHEIMYPLLQGYDSVAMDVDLEIGGTDQTFNMMMGRHLQRSYNNREKWVLTTPIIEGTDGRKMSKSYGNFIALTEEPNDMYGKLMSLADLMIVPYFTLLTDVPMDEIKQMEQAMQAGENPMEFKKRLALTITGMYHSTTEAHSAQDHFEKTVQGDQIPADRPVIHVTTTDSQQLRALDLVTACLPDESFSNCRRLIEQGAVEILNADGSSTGQKPTDANDSVTIRQDAVVRIGKRRYFTIKLEA